MANRPVFLADKDKICITENYDFIFYSGFSYSQKEKSINSLHAAFLSKHPDLKILEVSTKSPEPLGRELSAFNLSYNLNGVTYPLECVFQSSKVFEKGGPYQELLSLHPSQAKKSSLLQDSGNLVGFQLSGQFFPLIPTTFFYDWLYINSLNSKLALKSKLAEYDAFTDIEFNPNRSINCQARSAAIFVALIKTNTLDSALESPEQFRSIVYPGFSATQNTSDQMSFDDLF